MANIDRRAVQVVLFDLGNVVIDIDFMRSFRTWAKMAGADANALRDKFVADRPYEQFERGEIGHETYFETLGETLGISLNEHQWREGWNALLIGERPGMRALIERAKTRYPVYLFTNTNAVHQAEWTKLGNDMLDLFNDLFVSSELGVRKPEAKAYRLVAERMGVSPNAVVFFDDSEANIDGARAVGMQAVHTTENATVETVLNALMRKDKGGD